MFRFKQDTFGQPDYSIAPVNYRHAFHAGSFADVFKHAMLCLILSHLREKETAFRVIDTHAGSGVYDLTAPESARGAEWQDGIGRLMATRFSANVATLLKPYLDIVRAMNGDGVLRTYPGSPALMQAMLRSQDRMIACELHPDAAKELESLLKGDKLAKALHIDGWTALSAYVPPKERRGLVLIDPPFEKDDDFRRLADDVAAAHRKWATGLYALWYPIKGRTEPDALAKRLTKHGLPRLLRAELIVSPFSDPSKLNGSGLILINPPWKLDEELAEILPALARCLGRDGAGQFRLDWLAGETPAGH